ncbi:MAG TPA: hypothetical protein VGQ96_01930, partial [Candidatus Eremiobacteraceae bacterium]|nr:hypothetical protein [Candidatus Eremiobacteraceae bacterium]
MHRHLRLTSAWLVGCGVALLGLASPLPGQSADNPIKDVSYAKRDGAFELSVAASGPVTTRVSRFSVNAKGNTMDLVVDVSPASYDGQTKVIGFSKGQLQQVRVGQLSQNPAVMRIVVESSGSPKYDLTNAPGHQLKLALRTSQVAFALPTQQAVAAARQATGRHDTAIAATATQTSLSAAPAKASNTKAQPSKPVVAHPAPAAHAVAVAAAPVKSSAQAPSKPATASAHASAPTQMVVAAHPLAVSHAPAPAHAPAVVAMATPNPWL